MKGFLILITAIGLSGCASQDYQNYLNAKTQLASVPQKVIAEINGVKIYDQHPTELAPPQQPYWVSLLATAITMTGQVVLGVSGNNAQVDIVRALAVGIGSNYSSYSANVSTTNTGSGNSAGRDFNSGTKTDARTSDYTDSSMHNSFNPALEVTANHTIANSGNDSSQHPTSTVTTTETNSTTSTDKSHTNTDNPTTTIYPPVTGGIQ